MKWLLSLAGLSLLASASAAFPALSPPPNANARLKDAVRALAIESEDERIKAIQEIQSLGPWGKPALPALSTVLVESSPRVAWAAATAIGRLGPVAKDAGPSLLEVVRRRGLDTSTLSACARALAAIGEAGNPEMVRAILAADSDGRKVSTRVAELLALYPAEMIPVVADHLCDSHAIVRSRAAVNLHRVLRQNDETKKAPIESLTADVRKRITNQLRDALADASTRAWAVPAIIDLDPTTLPEAMPAFVTLVRRRDNPHEAKTSIVRCGPAAARLLLDYLDDPEADVRTELAMTLANCRGKIQPVLASGLRHSNPTVRKGALVALSIMQSRGQTLRPAIIGRLADDDAQVRLTAATTLVALDPRKATTAVPILAEAAFSRSRDDRLRAIGTLQTMGSDARPAMQALFRCVRSGDVETRFAAAQSLAAIDKSTWQTYVPALVETIAFGEVHERQSSARLLGETGAKARVALPALRAMLTDANYSNRTVAAEAMIQIAPDDVDGPLKCLVDALGVEPGDNRNLRNRRRLAIAAIVRIGAPAKPVAPALLEVMRNEPNDHMAMLAASAAIKLDPDKSEDAYERFRFHLQPTNPDPDDSWLDGIVQLGKAAKPLVPALIEALKSKLNFQQTAAVEALAMLGPDAKEALPALKEIVKSGKGSSMVNAAIAAIEAKK